MSITLTTPMAGATDLLPASLPALLRQGLRTVRGWRGPQSTPLALTHELRQGATIELARPLGRRLECLSGCLWITLDHDERDFIVAAGESFVAERDQRALVHALEAARVRVAPAVA